MLVQHHRQAIQLTVSFGQQRFELGDFALLVFHQIGGQVVMPVLTGQLELLGERLRRLGAGLFTAFHLADQPAGQGQIGIRNQLDVAQGHHPVFVHAVQPGHHLLHAAQSQKRDGDRHRQQHASEQIQAGGNFQGVHGESFVSMTLHKIDM